MSKKKKPSKKAKHVKSGRTPADALPVVRPINSSELRQANRGRGQAPAPPARHPRAVDGGSGDPVLEAGGEPVDLRLVRASGARADESGGGSSGPPRSVGFFRIGPGSARNAMRRMTRPTSLGTCGFQTGLPEGRHPVPLGGIKGHPGLEGRSKDLPPSRRRMLLIARLPPRKIRLIGASENRDSTQPAGWKPNSSSLIMLSATGARRCYSSLGQVRIVIL